MEGTEVGLNDMLYCRERRAHIQTEFIKKYHCPVISFCMNIPGPIKTNPAIRNAFEKGKHEILTLLRARHVSIADSMEIHEKTGDEIILAVNHPAAKLKKESSLIEESHIFGRLFDIDIINNDGTKLSRNYFRKCILCGRPAQECARARMHSIEEMQHRIEELVAFSYTTD